MPFITNRDRLPIQHRLSVYAKRQWEYTIEEYPSNRLAISIDDLKAHLRLPDSTIYDNELELYILSAQDAFETASGITILSTKFRTYREYLGQDWLLRKRPVTEIHEISIDGEILDSNSYSLRKLSQYGYAWANPKCDYDFSEYCDCDCCDDLSVYIDFTAGLAVDSTILKENYPDVYHALLTIAARFYTDRGDCEGDDCTCMGGRSIPKIAASIITKYKNISITINNSINDIDFCHRC